jgi:hypothetical protein
MRTSIAALLAGVLILVAFAAGCASIEQAREDTAEDQTTKQDTQRTGKDTTGERTKARGKDTGKARSGEATLGMEGDPGTEFSGSCTVGDEEQEISGQVPDSFSYELDGKRLECEINADGNLRIVFTANNTRSVQQISGGTLNLTYDNGQLSSSYSSSGSGGQVSSSSSQVSSSSQSSSSSIQISP